MLFNSRTQTSKAFPQRDEQVEGDKRTRVLWFCCRDLYEVLLCVLWQTGGINKRFPDEKAGISFCLAVASLMVIITGCEW